MNIDLSILEYNRDIEKAKKDFYIAIREYETLIKDYSFKIVGEKDYERIYCIDDKFYVYIGLDFWNGYVDESRPRPHILIEELSYNYLFKFNATKFGQSFDNAFYDIRVNRFYGITGKYKYNEIGATKFFVIDSEFPNLKLVEKAKQWEGVLCHFIIVELYDDEGTAATIKYLTNDNIEQEAQAFCRKIEHFDLSIDYVNQIDHKEICSKLKAMKEKFLLRKAVDKKATWTLRGHLRYFFVSERTTDYDLQSRGRQLLNLYNDGTFKEIEWKEYGRFYGKWKSELLVFEFCQKIYGKENVLFQYSPSFLGHMSYDVYIIDKNVAIEYQGKQHFEPVDFFGGQQNFEKQIERDKLKMKLSKENRVKLIYINYNEIISEQLIKSRIE